MNFRRAVFSLLLGGGGCFGGGGFFVLCGLFFFLGGGVGFGGGGGWGFLFWGGGGGWGFFGARNGTWEFVLPTRSAAVVVYPECPVFLLKGEVFFPGSLPFDLLYSGFSLFLLVSYSWRDPPLISSFIA